MRQEAAWRRSGATGEAEGGGRSGVTRVGRRLAPGPARRGSSRRNAGGSTAPPSSPASAGPRSSFVPEVSHRSRRLGAVLWLGVPGVPSPGPRPGPDFGPREEKLVSPKLLV